jgi:LysM repeat protein
VALLSSTVLEGDTVSGIAQKHSITTNTILWANDLANVDEIRPGDQIFILPIAGLKHIVAEGDTIESIAKKYKGDKDRIIAFNELPANGRLETGEEIIIPDGSKEIPTPPASGGILDRRQYATSTGGTATDISGWRTPEGKAGTGHKFPYGYCTWYVASKRYVPWGRQCRYLALQREVPRIQNRKNAPRGKHCRHYRKPLLRPRRPRREGFRRRNHRE